MDTTQTITHIGLCAGYGGIELGLKRVLPALRTVALCEIEAFAVANLVAKMEAGLMDPAPIWTDLKTFPWAEFRDRVDILTGGYPCQPFSAAGKRLGTDDPRHLWPYIASGIRLLRPKLCFFENVEGHISLGLREVVGELEELGYETTWGIFSAAECGAPHQRKRVFIMAVADGLGGAAGISGSLTRHEGQSGITDDCGAQRWPSRPGQPQHAWEPPRVVGNASSARHRKESRGLQSSNGQTWRKNVQELENSSGIMGNAESRDGQRSTQGQARHAAQSDEGMGDTSNERCGRLDDEPSQTSRREARGHADGTSTEQRQTESTLGGDTDGTPSWLDYAKLSVSCDNRTDELRLLGNGVVPATAELAFSILLDELKASVHL